MTHAPPATTDVLLCAGPVDIPRLLAHSVARALLFLAPLNQLHIVTPEPHRAEEALERNGVPRDARVVIHSDAEVAPPEVMCLPGWSRQQYIKLHADLICATPTVCCLGADTLICRPVRPEDLWDAGRTILYYSSYAGGAKHKAYERERVRHVAALLGVEPRRAFELADFVMDFAALDCAHLVGLRRHLDSIHGPHALRRVLPQACDTLEQRVRFGEWTLYAIYILDVLGLSVPTRNSRNRFVAQVHSEREFETFRFDATVVHFVAKTLPVERILSRIEAASARSTEVDAS